jgi:hypothetical protein
VADPELFEEKAPKREAVAAATCGGARQVFMHRLQSYCSSDYCYLLLLLLLLLLPVVLLLFLSGSFLLLVGTISYDWYCY